MRIQAIGAFLVITAFLCAPPLLAERVPDNQQPPPDCIATPAACSPGQATCVNPSCGVAWTDPKTGEYFPCTYVEGQEGACVCLGTGPYGSCTNS